MWGKIESRRYQITQGIINSFHNLSTIHFKINIHKVTKLILIFLSKEYLADFEWMSFCLFRKNMSYIVNKDLFFLIHYYHFFLVQFYVVKHGISLLSF